MKRLFTEVTHVDSPISVNGCVELQIIVVIEIFSIVEVHVDLPISVRRLSSLG